MSKKFTVLVADPPWFFFDGLKMSDTPRGASDNYKLMSNEDIKNIPVNSIADPEGAILALWVPSSLLQEGLDVMKAWGFNHKQTYVWVKSKKQILNNFNKWIKKNVLKSTKIYDKSTYINAINNIINYTGNINLADELSFGMGRLFRQTHEICLVGTNSNKIYKHLKNKSQRSVSFGENLRHSAKPEHLQDSLEKMFPDDQFNKIELFARRVRPGWTCLGNEVCNGEDINISIKRYL
jgi:hypothetical protein